MCHFAGIGQVTAVSGTGETRNPYGQSGMATQQKTPSRSSNPNSMRKCSQLRGAQGSIHRSPAPAAINIISYGKSYSHVAKTERKAQFNKQNNDKAK